MPRKPNYRFERAERDRVKAQKKDERLRAKAERQLAGGDAESGADSDPDTLHVTVDDDPTRPDENARD